MSVVDGSFGHPLKLEEKATMPLAGGIANQGYQCGMLWGASLAAGAQAYQLLGPGPQTETETIIASQRLVESFRARTRDEINCLEISNLNMQGKTETRQILKFFLKGGPIGCFRMAARYAPVAFSDINATISEKPVEAPLHPVSCAGLLAQKMGASEMHTVMAAGFASGIGLSGGACGALGAAIWITGMKHPAEPVGFSYTDSWIGDMIERFLKSTDFEFECSKITGRRFENVADHADYIRAGGCSKIIEVLSSALATP
jgi:hypothetical protein